MAEPEPTYPVAKLLKLRLPQDAKATDVSWFAASRRCLKMFGVPGLGELLDRPAEDKKKKAEAKKEAKAKAEPKDKKEKGDKAKDKADKAAPPDAGGEGPKAPPGMEKRGSGGSDRIQPKAAPGGGESVLPK